MKKEEERISDRDALISSLYSLHSDKNLKTLPSGHFLCSACKTTHKTLSGYVVHTKGKKHRILSERKSLNFKSKRLKADVRVYKIREKTENSYFDGILLRIRTKKAISFRFLSSTEALRENMNFDYLVVKINDEENVGVKIPIGKRKILKWFDGKIFKLQVLFCG